MAMFTLFTERPHVFLEYRYLAMVQAVLVSRKICGIESNYQRGNGQEILVSGKTLPRNWQHARSLCFQHAQNVTD